MLKQRAQWLVVIFLMVVAVGVIPAFAQETYSDPAGRFTTQIPAGWMDDSTSEYGLFTSDNGIAVYVLAVENSDVQAGIDAAVRAVVPDFSAAPVASNEVPVSGLAWTQNVYVFADGSLHVALGTVKGETTYVIYMQMPDESALVAKQDDLNSILFSFAIGASVDLSGQQPTVLSNADLRQITAYVTESMVRYGIFGSAVAIVQHGELVYSDGFGTIAKDDSTPVTDSTLFMIGSTTKSMTTMMTAALVDDGIVDWDAPVTDILPDFKLSQAGAAAEIRLRDLFNMSSGVPRYDLPISLQTYTPLGVMQEIANIPLATRPGEAYHYSNFMVALGGFADAVASGADLSGAAGTYGHLMQTRVFDPVGMSNTTLDFDAALSNPNHALPHHADPIADEIALVPIDLERSVTGTAPADAVWSNAQEMAQYLITLLDRGISPNGQRVVSEKNLLETWKPEIAMPGGDQYGMGWKIGSYHGQRLIQHGGNTVGFTTDFAFLPDANLGVLVLSNVGLANNFGASVHEYVFETAFGLEHTADAYYAAAEQNFTAAQDQILMLTHYRETPVDSQAVADYLGSYERGLEIRLNDAGQLIAKTAYGEISLLPTDVPHRFISAGVMAGISITFTETVSGDVTATLDSLLGPVTGELQSLSLERVGGISQ